MANLKWADVAHYYLQSNIELSGGFQILEYRPDSWCIGSEDCNEGEGIFFSDWSEIEEMKVLPILRALEDMTEGEALELFSICRVVEWDGWIGCCLYPDCRTYMVKYCKGLRVYASETHWLISKGFDVFGLIESGRAIRKGVENG